jgi:6-pyruvoyltetrahydropterin/6-carboxytetrahydropterin synthase
MKLSTLKRFEFSAARQLADGRWRGDNFTLWVGVTGPLDPATGFVVNLADLKAFGLQVLDGYDHRYLNHRLPNVEPTTINIARALWADVERSLPPGLGLDSVELGEEEGDAVLITPAGVAGLAYGQFSAAHRTHAPRLSDAENLALYGICNNPAGHGHNYRFQLALPAEVRNQVSLRDLVSELDHRNLSMDIPDLGGHNVVTETIAELIARRAPQAKHVRLWELPDFFADYHRETGDWGLGRRYRFRAAHRLHSPALSDEANRRLYGKCNRPDPHGHTYNFEVTLRGELDARTETAYDLGQLDRIAAEILRDLDHVYLDAEVPAFAARPSTGENIAAYLWERFASPNALGHPLESIRLWETSNNQFTATRG